MNPAYMKYMSNPKAYTLKRWFSELLKGKYSPSHDVVIERVSTSLVTDKDLKDFGTVITDVYEAGYMKAINDYKEQFEGMGIKINVVPGPSQKSQD